MSLIRKKFFENFNYSNLNDTEVAGPLNQQLPVYDSATSKWKNQRADSFLTLNKKEYTSKVTIETETQALMIRPEFAADIEIEANAILEIMA